MTVKVSATVIVIKDEIKKVPIDISIKYSNNKQRSRLVKELDIKENKKNLIQKAITKRQKQIDREARNSFRKGIGTGTINCIQDYDIMVNEML